MSLQDFLAKSTFITDSIFRYKNKPVKVLSKNYGTSSSVLVNFFRVTKDEIRVILCEYTQTSPNHSEVEAETYSYMLTDKDASILDTIEF